MPSAWMTEVAKTYAAGKKKHGVSYKYSQAMKDAKKTYKKKGSAKLAPAKKTRRKKAKKEEAEEEVGGSLRRKVKKKRTMKILKL